MASFRDENATSISFLSLKVFGLRHDMNERESNLKDNCKSTDNCIFYYGITVLLQSHM